VNGYAPKDEGKADLNVASFLCLFQAVICYIF